MGKAAPTQLTLRDGQRATKVSESTGSNVGGFYKAEDGQEWFFKFPKVVGQVGAELVSSRLAKLMGLHTKTYITLPVEGAIALGGLKIDFDEVDLEALAVWDSEQLADQLVHAAWTANWDPVDSNLVAFQRDLMVIDYGVTLLWAGQGCLRDEGFPYVVDELDRLRKNGLGASMVFGRLSDDQVAHAIRKRLPLIDTADVLAAADSDWFTRAEKALVQNGLVARKSHLEAWAGLRPTWTST